jgi:HD domain-containing protein
LKKSKRRVSLKRIELCSHSENLTTNPFFSKTSRIEALKKSLFANREYLLGLLTSLDGIVQSPKYHPESDALFHTLQVFELAYQDSEDPELLLAALFHDVGKSIDSKRHAEIGAEMISDFFPYRVVWLVEHHLDLMISPRKTQQRLANSQQLKDLVKLRAWDLRGRSPTANVCTPSEALDIIYSLVSK